MMPTTCDLFFDSSEMPAPRNAYVAWIDVMGVQSVMTRTLATAANFVFKLHTALLDAPASGIRLYPVMDGAYVVSENQHDITRYLGAVLERLALCFVDTPEHLHRFLARGALAYGPVVHGSDVSEKASRTLGSRDHYRNSLLLGMAMIQAVQSEHLAPPFGIYIHESARAFAPAEELPFKNVWWNWFGTLHRELAVKLRETLGEYFDWCQSYSGWIQYNRDRIAVHRAMATDYLVVLERSAPGEAPVER